MYLGVINLVDSHARRTAILADLAALGYAIDLIPAVDGRKSAARDFEIYNDRRARLRHGRSLNGGEVACYLSHIQTLQNFVASGADIGLILEDDMHLPADTRQKIDAVIACLALQHPRWQIANLTQHAIRCTRKIGGFAQHDIHRAYYFPMLTGQTYGRALVRRRFWHHLSRGRFAAHMTPSCGHSARLRGRGSVLIRRCCRPDL